LQKEIVALNTERQALDCHKKLGKWSEVEKSLKLKLEKNLKDKTSELRRKEKERQKSIEWRENVSLKNCV
jgi:hypothetical protein